MMQKVIEQKIFYELSEGMQKYINIHNTCRWAYFTHTHIHTSEEWRISPMVEYVV